MSKFKELQKLTDEEMVAICDNFTSGTEYLASLGLSNNGRYTTLLNKMRQELNLEWKLKPNRLTAKICPNCNLEFQPKRSDQVTCSRACSNTHFRSGENHYLYDETKTNYRTKCFAVHEKKCIVCGEDKIVAVHHYDENHENNDIENLIPLCPTHHSYVHSRYRDLVQPIIDEWRDKFIEFGHSPII
jgi:hypothetical protein